MSRPLIFALLGIFASIAVGSATALEGFGPFHDHSEYRGSACRAKDHPLVDYPQQRRKLFSHRITPHHCLDCGGCETFTPPAGVRRVWQRRIGLGVETRYHCLPCGRRIPYQVQVATFKERYSNGQNRVFKCVVAHISPAGK